MKMILDARPLVAVAILAACSSEPHGEARRLVQDVCLGYDDLRGRNVIQLEADPEIQGIHRRTMAACDLVDDGRAAFDKRRKEG